MPGFLIKSEPYELTFTMGPTNRFYVVLRHRETSKSYQCFDDLTQIGRGLVDPFRSEYVKKYFENVTKITKVEIANEGHICRVTFGESSVNPEIVLRLVLMDHV